MALYPSQDKALIAIQVFKKIDPTITPCIYFVTSKTLQKMLGTERANQLLQGLDND